MIKRLRKFKKSKQGAILILVVLILALAMIFIASAMMLTQATRTRLYENTVTSQARLTVTSAVEVFLEALDTQEITNKQMESVIKENRATDNSDKIKMVINNVPGMSKNDDNNCTYLDLYYTSSDHKKVNADFTTTIGSEVENVRVVLVVQEKSPNYGNRFKNQIEIASNVSDRGLYFLYGVGMVNPALYAEKAQHRDASNNLAPQYVTDNTIFVRGTAVDTAGGSVFYSDYLFTGGDANFSTSPIRFEGKTVLLDGANLKGGASGEKFNGDFYFIGHDTTSEASSFTYGQAGFWDSVAGNTNNDFIFSGRGVENNDSGSTDSKIKTAVWGSGSSQVRDCWFIKDDGTAVATASVDASNGSTYQVNNKANGSTVTHEIATFTSLYRSSSYNFTGGNNAYPAVAADAFKTINIDGGTHTLTGDKVTGHDEYGVDGHVYRIGDDIPVDGVEVINNPITEEFPYKNSDGTVDSKYEFVLSKDNLNTLSSNNTKPIILKHDGTNQGYYYFRTGGKVENLHDDPFVIAIDGKYANKYRLYFEGEDFDLCSVVFAIYNADASATPVVFVMESGANVHFGSTDTKDCSALCNAGIISINRDLSSIEGDDTPTKIFKYIHDSGLAKDSEAISWNGSYTYKDPNTNEERTIAVNYTFEWSNRYGQTIEYSKYYDSYKRPACFFFGVSGNEFNANASSIVEAYIGLYGGSYFGADNEMLDKNYPTFIYGRVECDTLYIGDPGSGSNGSFCMPYCPQPSDTSTNYNSRRAESNYDVADITYYTILT